MQGQLQTYQHHEKLALCPFETHGVWLGEEKTRQNRQTAARTTANVGLTASREDSYPYFPSPALGYQNLHLIRPVWVNGDFEVWLPAQHVAGTQAVLLSSGSTSLSEIPPSDQAQSQPWCCVSCLSRAAQKHRTYLFLVTCNLSHLIS